jgi:hypothetical protein
MIVPLKKRGSTDLKAGVIYEVQMFPCFVYVSRVIAAQQADTDLFSLPHLILFNNDRAQITRRFIRVSEDVRVAIKMDAISPAKR